MEPEKRWFFTKDRIKQIRKELCITQQEFADKIGISRGNIAAYEVGKNDPSDAVISLICREFNVSEDWLRNGTGDMFLPVDRDAEIAEFVGKALSDQSDTFKKRFIRMLSRLTEDEWALLERKALEIVGDHDSETPEDNNNEKSE